jgi:hypothetical protein
VDAAGAEKPLNGGHQEVPAEGGIPLVAGGGLTVDGTGVGAALGLLEQ